MKKFLVTLLALTMLLTVAAPALATDTVTYYLRGGTAEYEPYLYEELVGMLEIQKMADVDIDWTVVCGNGEEIQAQYLTMLASGNYPDVIQWLHNEQYTGGVSQLYADGIAVELNDYIDQYMPNLKKILEENPSVANDMMNDNGQYLYFTVINPLKDGIDKMGITWWGLEMRKDWLENVGMEAPATIDDWYEVLTAFKNGDPNGNGELDEIPFDAGSSGLSLFMPAFDIMSGVYIDPATGKVGYGEYSEGYKAYLETMQKWYAEGLIQNVFKDETGAPTDSADPNIFADLAGSWKGLSNYWEQRLPQVQEKNPNADFVAVQWPMDANGNIYGGYNTFSHIDRTTTIITSDCVERGHVEAVCRLIDTMYSEEGAVLLTWGIEDKDGAEIPGTYRIDENGNKYNTDWANESEQFHDGLFPRKFRYAMSHISFPRYGGMDFTAATREEQYVESSRMWSESDPSLAYPASIVLSADEQKAAAAGVEDMSKYIAEMQYKFITGQEPLTNYDNYIDTLQKMGMDDLIAAYQGAYDRYIARGAQE